MKYLVCPQCGIANFYLLNNKGEKLNVKVTHENKIIPIDNSKSVVGFNVNELFCLGCSWHGKTDQLKKY